MNYSSLLRRHPAHAHGVNVIEAEEGRREGAREMGKEKREGMGRLKVLMGYYLIASRVVGGRGWASLSGSGEVTLRTRRLQKGSAVSFQRPPLFIQSV